jgi:hypothetical protein
MLGQVSCPRNSDAPTEKVPDTFSVLEELCNAISGTGHLPEHFMNNAEKSQ